MVKGASTDSRTRGVHKGVRINEKLANKGDDILYDLFTCKIVRLVVAIRYNVEITNKNRKLHVNDGN